MKIWRNVAVFVAASLVVFSQPLKVMADRCDDVFEEANNKFEAAKTASRLNQYARAIELYKEAEGYYRDVSIMENCRCSEITGSALDNADICNKNVAISQRALENQAANEAKLAAYKAELELYEAEVKFVDISNLATEKFNLGNSYARDQQWEKAVIAYEEAAEIWDSIASAESENGEKALQSARESRNWADFARQQLLK